MIKLSHSQQKIEEMHKVRVRKSLTDKGRRFDYSYKLNNGIRYNDVTVKFVRSLGSFYLSFADSFWKPGEKQYIINKWSKLTKS